MELSEEEKKAIDYLKNDVVYWLDKGKDFVVIDIGENEKLHSILNLIDEQKKEIEEKNVAINKMSKDISRQLKEIEKLKFNNHMVKKWNEEIDKNCISKDKIREIIEHYDNELEHIKNGEEFENEKPMYYWGKVALENLLKEE